MSRHILQPRPEVPNILRAAVGWDRPLQTFFVQIFTRAEPDDEDGDVFLWVGTAPGELPTAEAALKLLAPYAVIPDDLAGRLTAEMTATIGIKDTAYQAAAKREIFGSLH